MSSIFFFFMFSVTVVCNTHGCKFVFVRSPFLSSTFRMESLSVGVFSAFSAGTISVEGKEH